MSDLSPTPSAAPAVFWPDLSYYGVTIGHAPLDGGKPSLFFSDETGKFAHIARNMGFQRTRWDGLWVRSDTRIEPSAFRAAFPKVEIRRVTPDEITQIIVEKIQERVEAHSQQMLPGFDFIDPVDPRQEPKAAPAPRGRGRPRNDAPAGIDLANPVVSDVSPGTSSLAVDGGVIDLSPLMAESTPLGWNVLGEEVFENRDGTRFVRKDTDEGPQIAREEHRLSADDVTLGRFLRGDSESSLAIAADGFVRSMLEGRIARVDELKRFFRATMGRDLGDESDVDLPRVVKAVDRARVRKLAQIASEPGADAFASALKIHESAQYYAMVKSHRMTPLPVSVVLQNIASAMPEQSTVRISNEENGEFSIFSEALFKKAQDGQPQDILLGAYEPAPLNAAVEALGTAVTRLDHAEMLNAMSKMSPDGLGIFIVGGDGFAGRIGPSSRRFLDALAVHHEIEGMVDLDGVLTGTPGAPPQRLIVVGKKRETPGHGGLPPSVPYVTDYESLWGWSQRISEAIRKPGSVPYSERGGVSRDASAADQNTYQAPYIPTSMISDPSLMVPRNLATPTRRAMLKILKETPHVDPWLETKLAYEPGEMKSHINAEQADAVLLGLKRQEQGLGFMIADQTGIGKGRIIASLVRAAKVRGEPVVFLTETADLFTDFWRDIEDIGADDLFRNVMVMNDDCEIVSTRTGEVVAKSAPREEVDKTLRSMKFPEGVDIVFATYSQFNRDPAKAIAKSKDLDVKSRTEVSESAKKLLDWIAADRRRNNKKPAKEILVEAVDALADKNLIEKLPTAALKSLWIGRAMEGVSLFMDECHNASGEASQTTLNFSHAVMNAKNVVYSSSTFARGEKNMRIYRRLFPNSVDVEGLHDTLKRGGEALQESLSSMLAEDGALIRREHDLSMIKFIPKSDLKRSAQHEQRADQLAEILAAMTLLTKESRQISDALSQDLKDKFLQLNPAAKDDDIKRIGVVNAPSMGNKLYMTMRTFMTLIKTEFAVEEALEDLREGRKPVIVIEHTMEAELNRQIERQKASGKAQETMDGLMIETPNIRSILKDMLWSMTNVDVDGKDLELKKRPQIASIIRDIEALIDKFPDMPSSPLDIVRQGLEQAGYKTGEISGRKNRLKYLPDGKCLVVPLNKKNRKHAKDQFNNGDIDALVLTRAGNSGISLHASERFINRAQRTMIEVEVPEDVIVRTQFFGRVNRNGQVCPPLIKTLSSGLPAEDRVLALQNNKLRRMSANVTANRDNAAITRSVADVLNIVGNEVAYRFLMADPELASKLDIRIKDALQVDEFGHESLNLNGDKYVSELMSRLVMLPVAQQREVIDIIGREFNALCEELDAKGENPLRPKFFDIHAKRVAEEVIEVTSLNEDGEFASTFDRPVKMTTIEYMNHYKPMSVEELKEHMEAGVERQKERIDDCYSAELSDLYNEDPEAFNFSLIDHLLDRKDQLLLSYKSERFQTVADALAADDNNMVKQMDHKINTVVEMLSTLRIGSVVKFDDSWSGPQDCVVVTAFNPPVNIKDLHNLGQYEVKLAIPGDQMLLHTTLSALVNKKDFEIRMQQLDESVLEVFRKTVKGSHMVARPILDGNMFRAAELSLQKREGVQAHFSDENGMSNRAVVLPIGSTPAIFKDMPLRLKDVEPVKDFFRTIHGGSLGSTGSPDGRGLSLSLKDNELVVSVPGNTHWVNWLRNHQELMTITGPFAGSRDKILAVVPKQHLDALVDAIYKTGITLYASASSKHHCFINSAPPGAYLNRQNAHRYLKTITPLTWFREYYEERNCAIQNKTKHAEVISLDKLNGRVVDPLADALNSAKRPGLKVA